jgi:hypothetical protein
VARQADVLPDLQEQVDGGIPVGAVRGGALQRDAVDLLRADQVRRVPAHHRQRRRLCHRDYLHHHVPRLRSQEGQGSSSMSIYHTTAAGYSHHIDLGSRYTVYNTRSKRKAYRFIACSCSRP